MSFYTKYLEAYFTNDTCHNDFINFNTFAYDLAYHQTKTNKTKHITTCLQENSKKQVSDNSETDFLNNTAVFLVDLNLYAKFANQLAQGLRLNNHELNFDYVKPQVFLVDYRVFNFI